MLLRTLFRVAVAISLAAGVLPFTANAQSQDAQKSQSVAEAARRSREQAKKSADKPAHVFTDDDLKPASAPLPTPVAASTPQAAAPSAAPASDNSNAASQAAAPSTETTSASAGNSASATVPGATAPDKKAASPEEASLKAQIAQLQTDYDFLKRELALDQDNYFSNPDYVHDTAGKTKLDTLGQQINDKQQKLEALKARLAALLNKLGTTVPAQP